MNNLRKRRGELGLMQTQISAWLMSVDERYDVSMVSRLENGVCLPTAAVLKALTEVLQAPASDLYGAGDMETIHMLSETDKPALPPHLERVVGFIPVGKDRAISRSLLRTLTGISDRMVRRRIEEARGYGVFICNAQDGRGYYQSDDMDEIERQYWRDKHRALSILYRLKHYRRMLKDAGRDVE